MDGSMYDLKRVDLDWEDGIRDFMPRIVSFWLC